MPQQRVAIAGATGYAGEELIRILLNHPSARITALAASTQWEQPVALDAVFPRLAGRSSLSIAALDPDHFAQSCDVAFLALPHGVSMDVVPKLLAAGCKVVDLGADFRLRDAAVFERWYQTAHRHPEGLRQAVYGLSEWARDAIREASLVANPGCYATSVILAAAPLIKAGLINAADIVVDAKSGLTGAGRGAQKHLLFSEINENLWPYKVGTHQHVPEMVQALRDYSMAAEVSICFVPQVVPLNRGILSNLYLTPSRACTWQDVYAAYQACYADALFVRLHKQGDWPALRDVASTNYCDIGFRVDAEHKKIIVSSALDNLLKGAAGQAVQNFNLMCGFPETTALI